MKTPIELDSFAGNHITAVCEKAIALASHGDVPVHFTFNGTEVLAHPGETATAVQARWQSDYDVAAQAYRDDPQRLVESAEREAKDTIEREAIMVDASVGEAAMRNASVPWPKTEKQLLEYIGSLVDREHSYGTCVYAISMAATAAFHYVAGQLGATGFQAGCADLDVVRRTRPIEGPFLLVKGEDALFPQYDVIGKVEKALVEWKPWLAEQAAAKLAQGRDAHPDVVRHWEILAGVTQTSSQS